MGREQVMAEGKPLVPAEQARNLNPAMQDLYEHPRFYRCRGENLEYPRAMLDRICEVQAAADHDPEEFEDRCLFDELYDERTGVMHHSRYRDHRTTPTPKKNHREDHPEEENAEIARSRDAEIEEAAAARRKQGKKALPKLAKNGFAGMHLRIPDCNIATLMNTYFSLGASRPAMKLEYFAARAAWAEEQQQRQARGTCRSRSRKSSSGSHPGEEDATFPVPPHCVFRNVRRTPYEEDPGWLKTRAEIEARWSQLESQALPASQASSELDECGVPEVPPKTAARRAFPDLPADSALVCRPKAVVGECSSTTASSSAIEAEEDFFRRPSSGGSRKLEGQSSSFCSVAEEEGEEQFPFRKEEETEGDQEIRPRVFRSVQLFEIANTTSRLLPSWVQCKMENEMRVSPSDGSAIHRARCFALNVPFGSYFHTNCYSTMKEDGGDLLLSGSFQTFWTKQTMFEGLLRPLVHESGRRFFELFLGQVERDLAQRHESDIFWLNAAFDEVFGPVQAALFLPSNPAEKGRGREKEEEADHAHAACVLHAACARAADPIAFWPKIVGSVVGERLLLQGGSALGGGEEQRGRSHPAAPHTGQRGDGPRALWQSCAAGLSDRLVRALREEFQRKTGSSRCRKGK